MSKKAILGATAVLAIGVGGYLACDSEEGVEYDEASALQVSVSPKITLPLRDNPDMRPTQILIAVGGVSARHVQHGWLDDVWATAAFDLLAPEQMMPTILGTAPLPEGRYDQLRFNVVYAGVERDHRWYPLEIPSVDESGLKVNMSFCLIDGETHSLDLDWNAEDNLHYSEERGYWLTPVLDVSHAPTCADDMKAPGQEPK